MLLPNAAIRFFWASAATLLLATAAGATSHDEIDLDQLSPWASDLNENMVDTALVGDWRMVGGQIETGGNTLPFRTGGRVLSILPSGSSREDYSGETNDPRPATDIEAGQVFGSGPDRISPKGTCQINATGTIIGHIDNAMEVDLDSDPPIVSGMTLQITLNPAASTKPKVRCAGDSTVYGNMVTPALGMGFTQFSASGSGPYVSYGYRITPLTDSSTGEILQSWYGLEIWSDWAFSPAPGVRYFFVRN